MLSPSSQEERRTVRETIFHHEKWTFARGTNTFEANLPKARRFSACLASELGAPLVCAELFSLRFVGTCADRMCASCVRAPARNIRATFPASVCLPCNLPALLTLALCGQESHWNWRENCLVLVRLELQFLVWRFDWMLVCSLAACAI